MLWFIIAGLIWLGITIYFVVESCTYRWFDSADIFIYSALTLVVAFLMALLLLMSSTIIVRSCDVKADYKLDTDTKIVAFKDNSDITGARFIFSGHVDDDLYYYYATDTELGYKVDKVKASKSYIRYSDTTHIEKYEARYSNWFIRSISIPASDRYVIYCPDKTICQDFEINLE